MIARVTWGKIKPGKWDEFQRLWVEYAKQSTGVPGARGRILLRDAENQNAGYAITFWDSMAAFEAHQASRAPSPEIQACFVGQYVTTVTDVSGLEVAELIG